MAQLLEKLSAGGELDPAALDWARAHQAVHGGTLDSALLELDLIDEESLLRGLESCFGLPAALAEDALSADPEVGKRIPRSLSEALAMCPVRITKGELVALVERPLSDRWVEELRLAGLGVRQLVAPAHYLDLARGRVYGPPTAERARELEVRLAPRREAAEVGQLVASIEHAQTMAAATVIVLDFAATRLNYSCFLVSNGRMLRVGAVSGGERGSKEQFPVPPTTCTFGAAIQYGGYFVGPIAGTQADHDFYRALSRPLPRWAFVAPVPMAETLAVVFYADNGPRGMATRWIAELTLLVARLGQHARALSDRGRQRVKRTDPPPASTIPDTVPARVSKPPLASGPTGGLTAGEGAAIDRLRLAAGEAGMTLEAFVDELLTRAGSPSSEDSSTALAGEVRGLFEKLATDIPTQLAKGMEAAFRNMGPRLSQATTVAGASAPATARSAPSRPPPAANVELVRKGNATREVASYRSRRRRSKRHKL